jgi:pimeloyl-ACP methyl ester carboxylesterase
MLSDRDFVRSDDAFGLWYERVDDVADETFEAYLRPHVESPQRVRDLERFFAAWDNKQRVAVEKRLKALTAPTLIVWGTDDVFFDVKWSRWLERTIPGTMRRVEYRGARLRVP